jgi:rod shape-determining protein MreC
LVGRVRQVSATGAEVLLITDNTSAVTARVLNPGNDSGVVRGTLNGELLLDFVDINAQISEAQQVYTTSETQAFPPNLLIGQLASVRLSDDGLFLQGTVESLVDFERLQLVLVITDFEPVEIEIFQSTPAP